MSITLHIRTAGYVVGFLPGHRRDFELTLEEPLSLSGLLEHLQMRPGMMLYPLVNGVRKDLSYAPKDGEEVTLWAPPGGG